MSDDTKAALARALAHERRGDAPAAADDYLQLLAAVPECADAHAGLARIAFARGDTAAVRAHARAGLAVAPAHAGLLATLGHALRAAGALGAAIEALDAAARAAPNDASGWLALGNACMDGEMVAVSRARGDSAAPRTDSSAASLLERALDAFARASALMPGAAPPAAHLAMAARYACDRERAASALRTLDACYTAAPEGFAFSPLMAIALLDDAPAQRVALRGWSAATLPPPAPRAPALVSRRGTRLRVGYLSSDLHDHATAHLAAGLFEHHDRARIETFAYAADVDDGSAMRRRLRAAFEHWRDVQPLADATAAAHIREDALDVLVDLKGHTHGTRIALLAERPAPVQIHYLGFPGTIAYDAIDGFVADDIVAPRSADAEFAEPLLRLPRCYQVNDDRRPLPPAPDRPSAGLPERALVLASFNQTYKLAAPFVDLWMETLRAHRDAVLWLAVPHALARRNLRARAEQADVAERVVFAPVVAQTEHIARLRCADVALDALPYGSHTTGSDALFAGVPLLTCRGSTFAGRVGASLCHAVELPELVAESPAAYAALLDALCRDRTRLAHYRQHLETRRARLALFDTEGFTRDFERMLGASANAVRR